MSFLVFALGLVSDELELFLPKYSQTAILHAAHFLRVVNVYIFSNGLILTGVSFLKAHLKMKLQNIFNSREFAKYRDATFPPFFRTSYFLGISIYN